VSPINVIVGIFFLLLPEILIVGATLLSRRWPAFVITWVIAAAVTAFQLWLARIGSGIAVATTGDSGSSLVIGILLLGFVMTTIICGLVMSSKVDQSK
jgi:hypothetical protein